MSTKMVEINQANMWPDFYGQKEPIMEWGTEIDRVRQWGSGCWGREVDEKKASEKEIFRLSFTKRSDWVTTAKVLNAWRPQRKSKRKRQKDAGLGIQRQYSVEETNKEGRSVDGSQSKTTLSCQVAFLGIFLFSTLPPHIAPRTHSPLSPCFTLTPTLYVFLLTLSYLSPITFARQTLPPFRLPL